MTDPPCVCVCPCTLPHDSRGTDGACARSTVRVHRNSGIGCVMGTSVPTENISHVRVCKVDVSETHGLDWVGITCSASALMPIMVNLGFPDYAVIGNRGTCHGSMQWHSRWPVDGADMRLHANAWATLQRRSIGGTCVRALH